jgi:phenylalanyl-tRNA synthetase beta chain
MAIETDLIEEVARIHGYQNLPTTDPVKGLTMYARPEAEVPQVALRRALTGRGYQEVVSYSFVDPGMQAVVDPEREAIALANPLSADLSVMRTSLWSGLLSALRYNQNRQQPRVRVFEAGLVFRRGEGGEIAQRRHLGGAVWGALLPEQWGADNRPVDIYDIKGDVEALLGLSGRAQAFSFQARANPTLHPGQSAVVLEDGEPIGWLGALHPTLEGRLDIAGPVYLFELALDALQRGRVPVYRPVSRFPAIRRDLAVVVEGSVAAAEVAAVVREAAGERLADLKLFDVYAGKGIDPGRKSLALGLTLQDPSRTLTDTEVEEVIQRIVRRLAETVGATLRD